MARQYRLARKIKKIALTAAAKELGVSQPTLSSWESERKAPSIDGLIRMAQYYGVSTDFLLGLTNERDPRMDWVEPIHPSALPVLHGTPVFMPQKGWAFVDAVEQQLHFASGETLPFLDAENILVLPPAYTVSACQADKPLGRADLASCEEVWVEPISDDSILRNELRGWYVVKKRYVENSIGQRFSFDLYGSKWLAFLNHNDGSTE